MAPSKNRPLLHLVLVLATGASTFATYFLVFTGGQDVEGSFAFSVALMSILGAHEMGHYLWARVHQVDTSLPYFIPLPLLGVGTLGAVIRIRGKIPTRDALVDIGAAGPLAGLAVALPVTAYGLGLSRIDTAPVLPEAFPPETSLWALGVRLYELLVAKLDGVSLPVPVEALKTNLAFGDSLAMQGLQYLVLGPLPDGKDVFVHPLVVAGWFGFLVTMLNLLPVGQLDGGHLTFALFGKRARAVGMLTSAVLATLTVFASASWLLWLLVTAKVVGFDHPQVEKPLAPLSWSRKAICAASALALFLCAMPIPLRQVALP